MQRGGGRVITRGGERAGGAVCGVGAEVHAVGDQREVQRQRQWYRGGARSLPLQLPAKNC